jgi:hypothetical protein
MADPNDKSPNVALGDLRDVTLRIPGEHFFCETLSLPDNLIRRSYRDNKDPAGYAIVLSQYVEELLNDSVFSPYPSEQLAWGYHFCQKTGRILIFSTPLSKLGKLGWENLELFRRVFPSFISILGTTYEQPSLVLFICDETLTAASFPSGSSVPDEVFSLPFDPENEESFSLARSKLLSLSNLENYQTVADVLVAGEVFRNSDGFFEFDHYNRKISDSSPKLGEVIRMSADDLWNHDLRSVTFKEFEKRKRLKERKLWRALKLSCVFLILLIFCFLGVGIFELKQNAESEIAENMAKEVPLVLESQKLLEKLKQNKLGGIDPFGSIARLTVHRGGDDNRPSLWFSKAHFETRSHMKLEGEGINVESVNTFISNIENNGIARIRNGRGGEEMREIKSDGGKTTFEVEIDLLEAESSSDSPKTAPSKE